MALQWDSRLISQAEALDIGGQHPVAFAVSAAGDALVLRCTCGQSCGLWIPGQPTDVNDILAGVVRHLVMAHDIPLNRPARERMRNERSGYYGISHPGSDGGKGRAAVDGPGPGRAPGPGLPDEPGARVALRPGEGTGNAAREEQR
jgi:hypothetical protein